MTRAEHVRWCKKRALEYLNAGNLQDAYSSMMSDLQKHPETNGVAGNLGGLGLMYILHHDVEGMRRFIEGFRE